MFEIRIDLFSNENHIHALVPINNNVSKNLKDLEISSSFSLDPKTADPRILEN
jgi:hypothetical protein